MAANRASLVDKIQKALGKETSKAAAERALTAVLDSIKSAVKKDKGLQIVGFGTFKVRDRKARAGINPKTGEKIKIKASRTVAFKPGAEFKKSV